MSEVTKAEARDEPTITLEIFRPSAPNGVYVRLQPGIPVKVSGRVHWEPRTPDYVRRVELHLFQVERDADGRETNRLEVDATTAEQGTRFAGGFGWKGELSSEHLGPGEAAIQAVAIGQSDEELKPEEIYALISAGARG